MTVAIVGAAECDLGVTGSTVLTLQSQAILRALDDAGLSPADVDGLATNGVGRFPTTQVADHLGLQLSWTDSSSAGGSVFEMYVARAVQAIEAGQCRTAVISFASNQRSARSRSLAPAVDADLPEAHFETPYGPLYPASYYAMAAQRYLDVHDTGRAALAEIAVAAREWALLNPAAFRYGAGPLTAADVLAAAPVSSPLGVLDCCLVTDGGGAVVLTSLERARDLQHRPVSVLGYGEATTNASMSAHDDLLTTGAVLSGRRAFAGSGVSPADVDVSQLYDSFTVTVLLTLEALGFCGPGEGAAFVADGRLRPGWGTPINTNGGGLSYCHPGQYGVLLLVEAARQLRGACGPRQVPGAEVALVHGTGGILSSHATVLLGGGAMTYDEWWDATRERRFLVQRCAGCGRSQHPPRPVCRHCHGVELAWHEASGAAEVDAWTTVHRSPGPGFDPPYVVARVRLAEGPIVLTHLTGAGAHRCGDPVRLSWRALPDGRHLPVFDPMED